MPRKPTNAPRTRGKTSAHSSAQPRKLPAAQPPVRAEPVGSDQAAAAAIFQGPQHMAALWSQWAEQMQRAGEQTMQGLRQDAVVDVEDVKQAETPQQLAGLPIGVAAEQAAHWAQFSTQITTSLLDMQAAWFKDVERVVTQLMSPWLTSDGRIAFASAQDLVEPPEPNGPMQMWQSAQKIWSESAKVWLQAMSHDLQTDEPVAPAR
jgi:hypothetical protein